MRASRDLRWLDAFKRCEREGLRHALCFVVAARHTDPGANSALDLPRDLTTQQTSGDSTLCVGPADSPEQDLGAADKAGEIVAEGGRIVDLARGNKRHIVEGFELNLFADFLLGGEVGRVEPVGAESLYFRIGGPAEPSLFAVAA